MAAGCVCHCNMELPKLFAALSAAAALLIVAPEPARNPPTKLGEQPAPKKPCEAKPKVA